MKRRQYRLLRHLKSLCLMTHSGIEVEITRISKEPTDFMLYGKLKTECKTISSKPLRWTPYGRYLFEGGHPMDLYVFREGEPFERLDLLREMSKLKLETRENRRRVVITDIVGSYYPIRGYATDEKDEIVDFMRLSWTKDGGFYANANCALDLMEVIEK